MSYVQKWVLIIVHLKYLETATPLQKEIQSVVQSDLCLCCGFCYHNEERWTRWREVSHITLCLKPAGLMAKFPFVLINIIWKSYQQWGKYKMFELLSSWQKNFFLMILCQTWKSLITYWSKNLDKIKWYQYLWENVTLAACPIPAALCPWSCTSKAAVAFYTNYFFIFIFLYMILFLFKQHNVNL